MGSEKVDWLEGVRDVRGQGSGAQDLSQGGGIEQTVAPGLNLFKGGPGDPGDHFAGQGAKAAGELALEQAYCSLPPVVLRPLLEFFFEGHFQLRGTRSKPPSAQTGASAAAAVLGREGSGTNRAIAFPRRAMMISSPVSTRSSSAERCALA